MSDDPHSFFESDDPQSTFADEEPKLKRGDLVIHDRTWQEIWRMAITKPSLATYEDILRDRVVTVGRGATWIYIVFVFSTIAGTVAQLIFGNIYSFGADSSTEGFDGFGVYGLILAPFLAAIGLGIWLILLGFNHLVARYLLGGKGDLDQLVFATASFYAPTTVITGLMNFIPIVGLCINFLIVLYDLFLAVIAMNATHQFGWAKAIIATLIIPLGFFGCMCGCFFLLLLGPAIGGGQGVIDWLFTPLFLGR